MALLVTVSINRDALFTVAAQRMSRGADATLPDTVNDYLVSTWSGSPTEYATDVNDLDVLQHRYGDGASVLARKMLELAETVFGNNNQENT